MQKSRITKETLEIMKAATKVVFAKKDKQRNSPVIAYLFVSDHAHPFIACFGSGDLWEISDIRKARAKIRTHNKQCVFIDQSQRAIDP